MFVIIRVDGVLPVPLVPVAKPAQPVAMMAGSRRNMDGPTRRKDRPLLNPPLWQSLPSEVAKKRLAESSVEPCYSQDFLSTQEV